MTGRSALWFAFLGGPVAWSAHLLASYPLVPLACERGSTLLLNLVTLATLAVALAAAATAYLALRRLRSGAVGGPARAAGPEGAPAELPRGGPGGAAGDGRQGRGHALFMARFGLWASLFFAFVIVVEGLPPILQSPCVGVG